MTHGHSGWDYFCLGFVRSHTSTYVGSCIRTCPDADMVPSTVIVAGTGGAEQAIAGENRDECFDCNAEAEAARLAAEAAGLPPPAESTLNCPSGYYMGEVRLTAVSGSSV